MYNWINQYNENGLEGLTATSSKGRGSGRGNKKVEDEVFVNLKKAYIKEQFDIEISQQAIAYRMKKI